MMKLRTSIFMILSVAILAVAAGVWAYTEHRTNASKEKALNTEEQTMLALQAQVAKSKGKVKGKNPLDKQQVPTGSNQADLIREISRYAKNEGVSLQSVTFAGAGSGSSSNSSTSSSSNATVTLPAGVSSLDTTVQATGSSAQLLAFVNDIQTDSRLSILQSLSITASQSGKSGESVSLQFDFPYSNRG